MLSSDDAWLVFQGKFFTAHGSSSLRYDWGEHAVVYGSLKLFAKICFGTCLESVLEHALWSFSVISAANVSNYTWGWPPQLNWAVVITTPLWSPVRKWSNRKLIYMLVNVAFFVVESYKTELIFLFQRWWCPAGWTNSPALTMREHNKWPRQYQLKWQLTVWTGGESVMGWRLWGIAEQEYRAEVAGHQKMWLLLLFLVCHT